MKDPVDPRSSPLEKKAVSTEPRPRILAVDDDITIREMIEAALKTAYDVRSLPSGDGVPALIESFDPQLILLDINLPGTDGFGIGEKIRRTTARRHLPILFMTVRSDDKSFLAALGSGGDSVIVKPFEIPALKERIERLLDAARD